MLGEHAIGFRTNAAKVAFKLIMHDAIVSEPTSHFAELIRAGIFVDAIQNHFVVELAEQIRQSVDQEILQALRLIPST
jgi:hypothetical protein